MTDDEIDKLAEEACDRFDCLTDRDDKVRQHTLRAVRRALRAEREHIKHTSHKDGLGMGDQRSEELLEDIEGWFEKGRFEIEDSNE